MASIDESKQFIPLNIAVLTVSDTRALADDKSGQTLADRLTAAGHHIQNLLGIIPRVNRLQQQAGSKAEANALQVKVELQADCLSGVWVNREAKKRPNFLEAGDIDAALTTASAIGDDTLQRQATGRVVPDSFTHGSAAQRKQWFMTGYQQGNLQACNTFGGSGP